jgi:hypothetical protein
MDFLQGGGPSEWVWPFEQRQSAEDQDHDGDARALKSEARSAMAEVLAAAATAKAKAAEARAAALAARLADLEGEIEQALEARAKAENQLAKHEEFNVAAASPEGRGGAATAVVAPAQSSSSSSSSSGGGDEGVARTWLRYLRGCYPLAQSCDLRHHWSTPFTSEPYGPMMAPWALEGSIDPTRVVAGPQTPVDPAAADPPKVATSSSFGVCPVIFTLAF